MNEFKAVGKDELDNGPKQKRKPRAKSSKSSKSAVDAAAVGKAPVREDIGTGGIQASRVRVKDRHKIKIGNRDPNFVYRVANSDGNRYAGRLDELKAMGYIMATDGEVMGDENGTEASSMGSVINRQVGGGTKGVLMKIPKEFYEQDMADKRAIVDKTEVGMIDESLLNASNVYGDGLKIT